MHTEDNFISASFGERNPPYSNWYYRRAILYSASGKSETAAHAHTSRSLEDWLSYAEEKKGKEVGFGIHHDEIVTSAEIESSHIEPDIQGRRIRIKNGASGLLARRLCAQRPPSAGFTREEQQSLDWLRRHEGREFALARRGTQMSCLQFFNTMPEDEAPGGFFIPRGLAEVIESE